MQGDLARRVVDAYGGSSRWETAVRLRAVVSASGLAFRLKRRALFVQTVFEMDVHRPRVRIAPINRLGQIGVLDGQDVRVEDADGRVVASRPNARRHFPGGRRIFWWDDLDMTYFAGYATWNYCTLPSLILDHPTRFEQFGDDLLQARFPATIPTHCPEQVFRFDRFGQLIQHDYTALVIGKWARAANVVVEHGKNEQGIAYTRRRRVTPRRGDGTPRKSPILIDLTIQDFELIS
ncbi:MAG: hypothetical protein IT350_04580 [Deltaproteobacteria bacterium]|nr:hypothetical protein [Deltaproteobacteria bacterium]